jgi:hypothetical protein
MAQARVEGDVAPVVVVAVEGLGDNVSSEIGRVSVLVTLVGVGQDVLERSLCSVSCRAAKRRKACGQSKRGTHEASDATQATGGAQRMQKQDKTRKDETEGCERDWRVLMKAWMKACQRCHWWGTRARRTNPRALLGSWTSDALLGILLRREAGKCMSVPCSLQYNGSIEALIRQVVRFTARAMNVRCVPGQMSTVSFCSQCLDVSKEGRVNCPYMFRKTGRYFTYMYSLELR